MEQRLSKILCSVFKLINNKTNPEILNELISLRETTYALRAKDILKEPKVNTTPVDHRWFDKQKKGAKFIPNLIAVRQWMQCGIDNYYSTIKNTYRSRLPVYQKSLSLLAPSLLINSPPATR